MAKLATCPGCTTQLALPEEATLSDRARCPRCLEEFLLMETVQFSIPTAEILPRADPESYDAPDAYRHMSDKLVPGPCPSATIEHGDSATDSEPSVDDSAPETELAAEPLPVNATLSDWEARLKRAIAADVNEIAKPANAPIFERGRLNTAKPLIAEPGVPETEDFEVPDTDLQPVANSAGSHEEWSPHEVSEDLAVTFPESVAGSVVGGGLLTDELPRGLQTDAAPTRNNRKRSPLRTLASASLGVIGIPLGLYALLWLRGPAGDMLEISQYLPSFMLPTEFQEQNSNVRNEQVVAQPLEGDSREPQGTLAVVDTQTEQRPAAQPLIRDDAAVAPASAELPVYQGPRFEFVDPTEFRQLLGAAEQAVPLLREGDLKSKESVASKGQAYMALAKVADKMSYLSQFLPSPADSAAAQAAQELIETALRDTVVQRDLPQIALRWWQYEDRPSDGIVLLGTVARLETTHAGTVAYLLLGDGSVEPDIPVLLGRTDHVEGQLIGVAGTIERNPSERLALQDSSLGAAVISHYSFALDPAAQ